VTGSDAQGAAARHDDRGDGPAPARASALSPLPAIDFAELCPAQPAARRKKGHGLQQIGLAGAVGTRQHYRCGAECEPGFAVIAEVGQNEPRHPDASNHGTGTALGFLCLGKHRNYMGLRVAFCQHSVP
jgi:hypothetical protein